MKSAIPKAVRLPLLLEFESWLSISAWNKAKPLPFLDGDGLRWAIRLRLLFLLRLPDFRPEVGLLVGDMRPWTFEPAGKLCRSVVLGDVIWMSAVSTRFPEGVGWTGMLVGGAEEPVMNIVADDVECKGLPGGGGIREAPI